ncbi:MAG: GntR family transcriptional regulator [Bryobacter sp.]|nr:GntR family transcriptional regulator [Bryobacter sp.]
MPLAPVKRKRATDEVYDSLRAAILNRAFSPGERLLGDSLAKQLGVSLTPVRHALNQLAVEGLIEIHPRSGTYVASMTPETVTETFEIRVVLEKLAARRAVTRVTDEDLAEFDHLLALMAKPVRQEADLQAHETHNLTFHRKLIETAASQSLLNIYESLHAHIQIARIHAQEGRQIAQLKPRLEQEAREHQAIVEALRARSAPRLEAAVENHILRAEQSLRAALSAPRIGNAKPTIAKSALHQRAKNQ